MNESSVSPLSGVDIRLDLFLIAHTSIQVLETKLKFFLIIVNLRAKTMDKGTKELPVF
jgi:hypothetical protein